MQLSNTDFEIPLIFPVLAPASSSQVLLLSPCGLCYLYAFEYQSILSSPA